MNKEHERLSVEGIDETEANLFNDVLVMDSPHEKLYVVQSIYETLNTIAMVLIQIRDVLQERR